MRTNSMASVSPDIEEQYKISVNVVLSSVRS
jgi:hypothetical protein